MKNQDAKLRPGLFRVFDYVIEVSTDGTICWWRDAGDEVGYLVGPGYLEHDTLVLDSYKVRTARNEDDPVFEEIPRWDQSRYFIKLDDFGGVAGPYHVETAEPVPDDEAESFMPALGFER